MTGLEIKAFLVGVMIVFGIVIPLPDFLGGMMVGMGVCYGVMIFSPPNGRKSLMATLFVGWVTCLMCAIAYPHIDTINWLPIQACMGVAGGLSRPLAEAFSSFGSGLVEFAKNLPNRFKIGGD